MAPPRTTPEPPLVPLRQLLHDALGSELDGWILLPSEQEWSLDTLAAMDPDDSIGEDEEEDEVVIAGHRLVPIVDGATLHDICQGAAQLEAPPSDDTLFDAFRYYAEFDAFLPALGAPDPPSFDELNVRLDREFFERLGPEDQDKPCRHDGCDRGSVRFSVLCRVHHFESIRNKPCPFTD